MRGSSIYKKLESRPATRALLQHLLGKKVVRQRKVVPVPADIEEDEEDDMEEMQLPKRKAPIFFQLFGKWERIGKRPRRPRGAGGVHLF